MTLFWYWEEKKILVLEEIHLDFSLHLSVVLSKKKIKKKPGYDLDIFSFRVVDVLLKCKDAAQRRACIPMKVSIQICEYE